MQNLRAPGCGRVGACYRSAVLGLFALLGLAALPSSFAGGLDSPGPGAPAPVDAFVPPVPISPLLFPWPEGADAEGGAVTVELVLRIGVEGTVDDVTILSVLPDPLAAPVATGDAVPLDEAALASWSAWAVALTRQLRFAPATEAGQPVAVELPLTIPFKPPPVRLAARVVREDGAPIAGVPVQVRGADGTVRTATTDASGTVHVRDLPDGDYTVVIEPLVAGGQELYLDSQPVHIGASEVADVTLYAHVPVTDASQGLLATYDRVRAEVVKHTLSADEVRTTPGTMGDPLRAIANLPGAVRTPLDAGWLIVRGGDPRDTGVYIDGVRVPLIYHLGGFTSIIHPGFIDHVEFMPGGQSARYGRSTAGVVDLVTKAPSGNVEVRAGANIILAGAYLSVPIQRAGARVGGFAAGFRRSYLDAVLRAVPTITDEQANIAPRFWDWQVRGDAQLAPGAFRLFGFGFVDTLDGSTGVGQRIVVDFNNQQLQGDWTGTALGKPAVIRPYLSYDLRQVTISAADLQEDRLVLGVGARAEVQDDGLGRVGWSSGVDVRVDSLRLAYNDIPRGGIIGSPEAYGDVRFGQTTRIVAGLRTDTELVTDQLPRFSVSPRASFIHPVSASLDLRADAGVYHQPPPYELMLGPPEGSALRLEYSWGGGAGATWRQGPFTVDADAFGRKIDNLTQYDADGSLGQGQGLALGVETMTRFAMGRFAGWLSLSWSRSLRREESSSAWTPAIYDQPVTLVLVGSEDLGKSWTLSSRFRYASGFPAPSDPSATAYDVLTSRAVPLTRDSHGRLPAFHALDLKISRHVVKHKLGLDVYLDVQNVYDRRIPEPVITGISDVYTVQAYGFGLTTLPIFGIEGVYQ